jgi:hypothetical protein
VHQQPNKAPFASDGSLLDVQANFEIVQWPRPGWRPLDPHTGDEAGTTEGNFDVKWSGDYFVAENLAIASVNNVYLDGLGAPPELASRSEPAAGDGSHIYCAHTHAPRMCRVPVPPPNRRPTTHFAAAAEPLPPNGSPPVCCAQCGCRTIILTAGSCFGRLSPSHSPSASA